LTLLLYASPVPSPLHRIIDANANRAREALRVMEDVARFSLNDPAFIESLKSLRHALRDALDQPALDRALLLSSRDADADPGRDIKTPQELRRDTVHDIASAAASRLAESLRSLEEAAKALAGGGGGANPAPIESL